uniref:Uncharacterized protein n=1 Tax=Neovison vison TaxID=452646 RepID=A0A8C7AFJ7_NEOVI
MQPTLSAVSSCTAPPSPRSRRSTLPPSSRLSRSRSRSTSGSIGGMAGVGAGSKSSGTPRGGGSSPQRSRPLPARTPGGPRAARRALGPARRRRSRLAAPPEPEGPLRAQAAPGSTPCRSWG